MKTTHENNKKIVIIGLGITGLSCLNYFLSKNIIPKCIDTRKKINLLNQIDPRVPVFLGDLNDDWILEANVIVVSPGISIHAPIFETARHNGAEVIGDVELFCRALNRDHQKVIAITGSNGKTTVTQWTYELLSAAGLNVAVGGNIGTPVLSLLAQKADYFVLELSSFQLETTFSLNADIAVFLNASEDHLDRYPHGMHQYVKAKQRIYNNARCVIYNKEDPKTQPLGAHAITIGFGVDCGDYRLDQNHHFLQSRNQSVLARSALTLQGLHNAKNALVVLAIGEQLNLDREVILNVLCSFSGLPHRYQSIGFFRGIEFINDSKATNVGSTIAALKSANYKGQLHLLLGGDGKQADFKLLLPSLRAHRLSLYCYGKDKAPLAQLLPQQTQQGETLQAVLRLVQQTAKAGDLVLLSPACASLDQFKNYEERGELFISMVKDLFQ